MKILFIHRKYESNAIEYLSAVLKEAGHKTALIFEPSLFGDLLFINALASRTNIEYRLPELVGKADPDLIAFSVTTLDYHWSCKIAGKIKESTDIPIVFGGIHPTLVPEEVIKTDFVDFLVIGEGEYAFRELVDLLESGKIDYSIKNIWFKNGTKVIKNPVRPLISNLDELPFPDKDIFYRRYPGFKRLYSIITSRGCPFQCTFCCTPFLKRLYKNDKNFIRRRSVDHVISELEYAKKKYGKPELISFEDDNFTSDNKWLEDFSRRYKKSIGFPYECLAHPVFVNRRASEALSKSDCNLVELGVQSFNEEIRRTVLRRYETNGQIKKALDILTEDGMFVGVDYIINLPGETIEDLIDFASLLNNYPLVLPRVYKLAYFPNTEITKMVFGEKIVDKGVYSKVSGAKTNDTGFELETGIDELSGRVNIDGRYIKTSIYSADIIKFSFFLTSFFPLLPKKINEIALGKELYKLIPSNKHLLNSFVSFLTPISNKIKLTLNNKKTEWHYVNLKKRLYMYPHFILHPQNIDFNNNENFKQSSV